MKKILFSAILAIVMILMSGLAHAAVHVNGYFRKNGTYVQSYYRSDPNGNPYDNYSYPGNYNPYTGNTAGGNPDTYLKNYYDGSSGGSTYYSAPTPIPTPSCPFMSSYNSVSGSCECYAGFVVDGSTCTSAVSYCWNKYGYNSSFNSISKSCECDYGYTFQNGQCAKPTPTPVVCPLNSYINGDSCKCNTGYVTDSTKSSCITIDQSCRNTYGSNSYGQGGLCYCQTGYNWDLGQTSCILSTPTPTPVSTPQSLVETPVATPKPLTAFPAKISKPKLKVKPSPSPTPILTPSPTPSPTPKNKRFFFF